MKNPSSTADLLMRLRLTLSRLDRTGDLKSPSIADLRRILLERILDLEAAERVRAGNVKPL
jgi:hypothetical protein